MPRVALMENEMDLTLEVLPALHCNNVLRVDRYATLFPLNYRDGNWVSKINSIMDCLSISHHFFFFPPIRDGLGGKERCLKLSSTFINIFFLK